MSIEQEREELGRRKRRKTLLYSLNERVEQPETSLENSRVKLSPAWVSSKLSPYFHVQLVTCPRRQSLVVVVVSRLIVDDEECCSISSSRGPSIKNCNTKSKFESCNMKVDQLRGKANSVIANGCQKVGIDELFLSLTHSTTLASRFSLLRTLRVSTSTTRLTLRPSINFESQRLTTFYRFNSTHINSTMGVQDKWKVAIVGKSLSSHFLSILFPQE